MLDIRKSLEFYLEVDVFKGNLIFIVVYCYVFVIVIGLGK